MVEGAVLGLLPAKRLVVNLSVARPVSMVGAVVNEWFVHINFSLF